MAKNLAATKSQKKVDPKDVEAQKIAEEQKRLEELRKQEELRKTEIITLPSGLVLILNEYCIQEAWKHPKPKEFLLEFITRYFRDKDLLENFESVELVIIAEFHLYNLIFCKETLELDDKKTTILMNIFWVLLQHNNIFYTQKVPTKGSNIAKLDEYFSKKTLQSDFEEFKKVLLLHAVDNPNNNLVKYFDTHQIKKIMEYVKIGYFSHYSLYRFILCNKQKNEEIKITVFVDSPLPVPPLSEALHMGQEKHEIKEDDDAEMKKEQEERRKKEEEERLLAEELERQRKEEEENRLDPKTMGIIQAKIKETQVIMEKQLEEREKMLQEKLQALDPKAKKKQ